MNGKTQYRTDAASPNVFLASVYTDQQGADGSQPAPDGEDKGGGVLFLPHTKVYYEAFVMRMTRSREVEKRMEEHRVTDLEVWSFDRTAEEKLTE